MDAFTGEIRLFPFNFAPQDWAYCDGSVLTIQQYPALYSIIGNIYGGSAGQNFKLPNLNGRAAMGAGNRPVDVPNRTANLWLSKAVTDCVRADGSILPADVSLSFLRFADGEYLVVYLNDVTERRRYVAALLQSEAQLRELSAHLETVREEEKAPLAYNKE